MKDIIAALIIAHPTWGMKEIVDEAIRYQDRITEYGYKL